MLSKLIHVRPTFAVYLAANPLDGVTGTLSPVTLKKIMQTVKRFLIWLKMTYAREFRDVTTAWIDALRPPRSVEPPADHEFVTLAEVQTTHGGADR